MLIDPNDPRAKDDRRLKPAPIEYAGQWVAWNDDRTAIVAHGSNSEVVWSQAVAAGVREPLLQKVRRPDTSFVGVR